MRVILSHLGSPDNLAFMYSPIVLTLTEGFARGGAHVVYGSTGERNGTSRCFTALVLLSQIFESMDPREITIGFDLHPRTVRFTQNQ